MVYPIGSLANTSVSTESEETFGSLLGERERKKPGKSKAPDLPSQGGVSGRSPEASPPQVSFLEGGSKDPDDHVP